MSDIMSKPKTLIEEFLNKNNLFAVVGVSLSPDKYGHKVYFDLLSAGYRVYPVHPDNGEIGGRKRYASLELLPHRPDVVSVVVPPKAALSIVKTCHKLGIDKVWLQPGSENEAIINYCYQHKIKVLSGLCIMVERLSKA